MTTSVMPAVAAAREQARESRPESVVKRDRRRNVLQVVLFVAGAVMLPLGLVVIGLGWYGAAHTPFVFEQMPYLISGGLLGVGLLTGGGLLYVGSWLARLAEQQRDDGEKIRQLVAGVRRELEYLPGVIAGGATMAAQQTFVATQTGTMFHRPECSVVSGRNDLKRVGPDEGLDPCKICQPTADT